MVLDIISDFVIGFVLIFVVGFFSSKFSIWGAVGIGLGSMAYLMLPGRDATEPVRELSPYLLDIWLIFPRTAIGASGDIAPEYGMLGILCVGIIMVLFAAPYLAGVWLGLTRYPEFLALRVVV